MDQFAPSLIATDSAVAASFLATLREIGTVAGACRASGVARSTLRRLRRRDRDFDAACASATRGAANDALEAAVLDRATYGVERVRTYADGRRETWREFDNALAWKLLAKRKPRPYGDGPAAAEPPRPVMSRAAFIAAIRMRPQPDAPEDDDAGGG